MTINTKYDVRIDSNRKDPDAHSKTLREYHRILWSKELPNGKKLELDKYLVNTSDACDYKFSSDSIINSYSKWKSYQYIIKQMPEEDLEEFRRKGSTIGGYIIFPKDRIDGLNTINQERGTNKLICDRFDLTLESIRLYYLGKDSPLFDCLNRYKEFFDLFVDFKGYVDFFLLNDLVSDNYENVLFFYKHNDFKNYPLPETVEVYMKYKKRVIEFVDKRNKLIDSIYNRQQL